MNFLSVLFFLFNHKYHHLQFLFLNGCIFNWRIIALQYCGGFCHVSPWTSHRYVYICPLPPWPPSHLPPYPTPEVVPEPRVVPWVIRHRPLAISFTYGSVYVSILPFPSPSLSPQVCSLCLQSPYFKVFVCFPLKLVFKKIFIYLAVQGLSCSMWNLSYLTRARTQAPCTGSTES